jgi:hypothetical protein
MVGVAYPIGSELNRGAITKSGIPSARAFEGISGFKSEAIALSRRLDLTHSNNYWLHGDDRNRFNE